MNSTKHNEYFNISSLMICIIFVVYLYLINCTLHNANNELYIKCM